MWCFKVLKLDTIMEAIGFRTNNRKSIPFSRLPRDIQVEVIEKLDWETKIKLIKVASGFRGYFASDGIFGRHVDQIRIEHELCGPYKLKIFVKNGRQDLDFDILKHRALFRNIRSCALFLLYPKVQRLEELLKPDADVKNMGEWFPNLCFVEQLLITRDPLEHEVLKSFHFKVTKLVEFRTPSTSSDLAESPNWEYLFGNQLSICEYIVIEWRGRLPQEIPGMTIEEDPEKKQEIFNAFKKLRCELWFAVFTLFSKNFYRRKIAEDKEMIMLVYLRQY